MRLGTAIFSVREEVAVARISRTVSLPLRLLKDLEGKEALLDEIRERRDLGQSVYEEMVDTALEISRLRESRLSVVSRFFKGWVDYLESTNKLDVSNIQL